MKFSANEQLPEPPQLSGNPGNDIRMMSNYLNQLRQALQMTYENLYSDLDSGASRFTIFSSGTAAGAYPTVADLDEGQLAVYLSNNDLSGLIFTRMNDKIYYTAVPLASI